MSRFTYRLLYVAGDKNVCADALSRLVSLPAADNHQLPGDTWAHQVNVVSSLHAHEDGLFPRALVSAAARARRPVNPSGHVFLDDFTRSRSRQAPTVVDSRVHTPAVAPATPAPWVGAPRGAATSPVAVSDPPQPSSCGEAAPSCGKEPSCGEETLPHEVLYDRLFQTLRSALHLDPATDTAEKCVNFSLIRAHDLLWHINRLYIPDVELL